MKIKKILASMMCLALLIPSNLADIATPVDLPNSTAGVSETKNINTGGLVEEGGTVNETAVVDIDVASEFQVTIPKSITLDGETKDADYGINVKGDIAGDHYVDVIPDSSFSMSDIGGKDDVTATITQAVDRWNYSDLAANDGEGTTKNGNISASGLTTGNWSGNFDFNIAYCSRLTPYIVNIYRENVDDDEYSLYVSKTLYIDDGETATPELEDYEGFITPVSQSGVVSKGSSNIFNFYYTRERYNVELEKGIGVEEVSGLQGKNLFNINTSPTVRSEIQNNGFINTAADTRDWINFCILEYNNDTLIKLTFNEAIFSTGHYSYTFDIDDNNTNKLVIKHSGATRDIGIAYKFTYKGKFTISFDVDGCDPSTVGGLIIDNIQIERGSQATSYKPYTNEFGTYKYGESVTVEATAENGYTASGWEEESNKGKNLINLNNAVTKNVTINNNTIINTIADARNFLAMAVTALDSNDNVVQNLLWQAIYDKGHYNYTFNITKDAIKYLKIGHSGTSKDQRFRVPFDQIGTFTISFDVESCDPATPGGLIINNVKLEEGNTATAYEPYIEIDVDNAAYNFRTIKDSTVDNVGEKEENVITGGTIAWNQLVENGDFSNGLTGWATEDGSSSVDANNIATASLTTTTSKIIHRVNVLKDHIYIVDAVTKAADPYSYITLATYLNTSGDFKEYKTNVTNWTNVNQIVKVTNKFSLPQIQIRNTSSSGAIVNRDLYIKSFQVFDLTQIFGTEIAEYIYNLEQTTAGAGVAWFKKYFPKEYYEYNSGELMSVNISKHKTVGFNQWDEEWENGIFNTTTGTKEDQNNYIRSQNYIKCLPNINYYVKHEDDYYPRIFWYDSNHNYISNSYLSNYPTNIITSPNNAYYFKLQEYGFNYSDTNKICINISDPSRNGTYEPYTESIISFDNTLELRGIPKIDDKGNLYFDGDKYHSDGTVERNYGKVNLGDLDWSFTSYDNIYVCNNISNGEIAGLNKIMANYINYNGNLDSMPDKTWRRAGGESRIYIKDSRYSTAEDLEFALENIFIINKLATPITEYVTPFTSSQSIDAGGTEEFVDRLEANGARDVAVPVGHETTYSTSITVNNPYTFTVTKNITLIAKATPITYTIGYNLNSGTATNPISYTVNSLSFTLTNPTREGYAFTGWTGSNGNEPQMTVTISRGNTGNKVYEANWQKNEFEVALTKSNNNATTKIVGRNLISATMGGVLMQALLVP